MVDINVRFDINRVQELDRQLALHITAEINSYLPIESNSVAPVTRSNMWEAPVIVPIGKPTVIFSSDTLDSKGAMQVVATVTPIP
jgi:hypothetical protein